MSSPLRRAFALSRGLESTAQRLSTDPVGGISGSHICANLTECAFGPQCTEAARAGEPCLGIKSELLKAAHWSAARYGLCGDLIDIHSPQAVAAKTYIKDFMEALRPALEAEGDWHQVSTAVDQVLAQGNGAQRQRQWRSQMGEWPYVVDRLIRETTVNLS